MQRIKTDFPHTICEIENTWIPLSDGTRLGGSYLDACGS